MTQACTKGNVYSRNNPSPEYTRLQALYQNHHDGGRAEKKSWSSNVYPGKSMWPYMGFIKAIAHKHGAKTMLDYGAGKGLQYTDLRVKEAKGKMYPSLANYWGVHVTCYDAGNKVFNNWPDGHFDGVVSTDVLEHCSREDLEWIISEIFEKAQKFVFANIACYPACTILSSGENAHITIEPPQWWRELIEKVAKNYPDISYYFLATEDRREMGELITNDNEKLNIPKAGALPGSIIKAYYSLIKQKIKHF